MSDASERYTAKRAAGLSEVRTDGSLYNPKVDKQAGAAEKFVCEQFGVTYNDEIYSTHGDGGDDFKLSDNALTVEVYHIGMLSPTKPRMSGHLIVSILETWRWAQVYIAVRGSIETGFDMLGWDSHEEIIQRPIKNFGFGNRYACRTDILHKMDELFEIWNSRHSDDPESA